MSKQFWAVIAAIIIVFIGIFALSGDKSEDKSSGGGNSKTLTQHITGNKDSGVRVVEYGDYQCPYCEQYHPVVKDIVERYKDQISFQFRNYPLMSLHANAFAAARAAEAASLQGKFWEMNDALYEQSNWNAWKDAGNPNPHFEKYAKQLGLDVTRYKADFASSKVNDLVNADLAEGGRLGITGTPTFYINGKKIEISKAESLENAIKAAISEQANKSGSNQ